MNRSRLRSFAEAYATALSAAVAEVQPTMNGRATKQYILDTTLAMLEQIERGGVKGVSHYVLNTRGGAFRLTCEALGIPNTERAMQDYLEE